MKNSHDPLLYISEHSETIAAIYNPVEMTVSWGQNNFNDRLLNISPLSSVTLCIIYPFKQLRRERFASVLMQ